MNQIKTFLALMILFFAFNANSQIDSVDYYLSYDTVMCRYDCYFIVTSGDASDPTDRLQFNAQYSIVVPHNTTVTMAQYYMPLIGNINYDGTLPMPWTLNSDFQYFPNTEQDFYSITPNFNSNDSRYNDLYPGDTIKIFSLNISPTTNCGSEIRIWNNVSDPSSSHPDMDGRDFDNGFTIGSQAQRYNQNSAQKYPPVPVVLNVDNSCSSGIEIDLTAATSSCQSPLTYQWTGPGYSSTDEDVDLPSETNPQSGDYKVVITDAFGCQDSITVFGTTKPDAGPDLTICAGNVDTIYGTNPTTGTWRKVGNPSGVTVNNIGGGASYISFGNATSGNYTFIYELPGCSDTMIYTVDPKPIVGYTGPTQVCALDTSYLFPTTGGTWVSVDPTIASVNNSGMVIGLKSGSTKFTFTNSVTGCKSTTNVALTVNEKPNVIISGSPAVCIGGTTTISPAVGGTWNSLTPSIAVYSGGGIVTGVSTGTASFIYTDALSGCDSDTLFIQVKNKPSVSITGNDTICVFNQTTLNPNTGGVWNSNYPLVAAVTNSGVVTGLTPGISTFIFTDLSTQCSSLPTDTVWVTPGPTVAYNGPRRICVLSTTNVTPITGGTWSSSDTTIAKVTNNGIVTATGQGIATLTFTDAATGCTASLNPGLIVDPIPAVGVDDDTICVSETTNLISPNGTWTNHTTATLTLNSGPKTITGKAPGLGKLTFKAQSGGCASDTLYVVVRPKPVVTLTDAIICVGATTTVTPSTGGTWSAVDANIASVTNTGLVTGKNAGFTTFKFTSAATQCSSDPTTPIEVKPIPPVQITGDNELCVGEFSSLSPTTGGTWVSSDNTIASVTNAGIVTAIKAGVVTFIFTDTNSGCVSKKTLPITIKEIPTVAFSGPSSICIGSNTNVSPATGGTWSSSNTSVAQITNAGLVTGYAAGTATLTYIETATSCPGPDLVVTVLPKPIVSILGPDELCIGSTINLSPNTGGGWSSTVPSVASVTNAGLVTALANGTTEFIFTSDVGCSSDATDPIIVNDGPTLIYPNMEMCIGDTLTLSPITGNWESSDSTKILPIGNGKIVALAATDNNGPGLFMTYTDTITGCSTLDTDPMKVNPIPSTNLQDHEVCVGSPVTIAPYGGGTWQSSNTTIATINNQGQITTLDTGKVVFTYTRLATGCKSLPSDTLTVTDGPAITRAEDELCIGETSSLTPTTGGTWTSLNPTVASVTTSGAITALAEGLAVFKFVEDVTLCSSKTDDALIVNGKPTTVLQGDSIICKGGSTQFTPSSGGTWTSSDPSIATITNTGLATGVEVGNVTFYFTDDKGCQSENTEIVRVSGSPIAEITGLTAICIGAKTTLSPSAGGTWISSDPSVASVLSNGVVTAIAPGIVTFLFQETATGCSAESTTGELTINNCLDPDFNVTYVDIPVPGDVSTNDLVTPGTTYGPNPSLTTKPTGSVETLVLGNDGQYTFTGNKVGVYVYEVPVCVPPLTAGCATTTLTITVLDHLSPANGPVANVDLATTNINTSVEIFTLSNDKCLVTLGCSLDPASVTIIDAPNLGTVVVDPFTGNTTYTPDNNKIGVDTLTYQVCVTGDLTNCAIAKQIIVINSVSAINSTVAADDFNSTSENQPVSGNVKTNDIDPEGDNQTITAYSVTVPAGTLDLLADGTYTFTPTTDFFGPVDFPYTTCDDNVSVACADATLHILVVPDLAVVVRLYLEGALMNNGNAKGTTHTRPLMRDNLRKSPYNNNNYIPATDPYEGYQDVANYYYLFSYNGNTQFAYMVNKYSETSVGTANQFKTIPDSVSIFAVTGEDAIVDWVWVELRDKNDNESILARRSGLLQRDGDVVDLNGKRSLRFPGIAWDDYYVVVKHRNHLGAMTANAQTPKQLNTLVNFTTPNTPIFDKGVVVTNGGITVDYTGLAQKKNAKETYFALWAGDFDGNGRIKVVSPNDDMNEISSQVLNYVTNVTLGSNYDFAYGYRQADWDLNAKVKFDNPDDDKNMLFASLLFYPLNVDLAANYDLFIEQLPEMDVD